MHLLVCEECGDASATGKGWRAYVTDDELEPAEVGIYCSGCAAREFDPTPWYHSEDA